MVYIPRKPRLTTRAGVRETLDELYAWKPELKENASFKLLEDWITKKFSIQDETFLDPASEELQRLKNAVLSMNKHVKVMEYEQREAERKESHKEKEAKKFQKITNTEWQRQIEVLAAAIKGFDKLLEKDRQGVPKKINNTDWKKRTKMLSVATGRLGKVKEWMQSKKE